MNLDRIVAGLVIATAALVATAAGYAVGGLAYMLLFGRR